jgi:hypothetical protein
MAACTRTRAHTHTHTQLPLSSSFIENGSLHYLKEQVVGYMKFIKTFGLVGVTNALLELAGSF